MRLTLKMSWMTSLAATALLAVTASPSLGETRVVTDGETLANGRSQTVVVTQRPLRTFRGEAVRVGRYAEAEKSIGVVRALRDTPRYYDTREAYSRQNRADRSDRWYDRHVSRRSVILNAYRDPYPRDYPRIEKSIGVVRAYRTYQPPVRNFPKTFTNPNAPGSQSSDASTNQNNNASTPQPVGDIDVTAVTAVEVPAAVRDDAWALLDRGYYREARQKFAAESTVDDAITRTGHALAAALSGDLAGGSALMPDTPQLPEGWSLSESSARRLSQTREFLYADNAEMQAALQAILDAGQAVVASEVSAN